MSTMLLQNGDMHHTHHSALPLCFLIWMQMIVILHATTTNPFQRPTALQEVIDAHYPTHYVARQLGPHESISIDGQLDDDAWRHVPFISNFLDLAGPRYARGDGGGGVSWREASMDYARRLTGSADPTRVKVRWDAKFLYVGAEIQSKRNITAVASVTGHCDNLTSAIWGTDTPVLPYFDDDFEVFVDPSQSNYFYVEFEMNARNATYSTLWTLPQAGLGSVAPECGGKENDGPTKVCCNTTWNRGRGLCDRGDESEGGSWTMEMYDAGTRPGTGMESAATGGADRWTLEVRFPILSSADRGGLINSWQGGHYPNTNPNLLDPNQGRRFWGGTFSNALHAPWWSSLNATMVKRPKLLQRLCRDVVAADEARQGFSQFLVDANNAATTCYYEAASQNLGGHRYMHNPDYYGYLEFAPFDNTHAAVINPSAANLPAPPKPCRNIQWLARFALAQIYQAQVRYLTDVRLGNGTYAQKLDLLLLDPPIAPSSACTIENACNATALRQLEPFLRLRVSADTSDAGKCVRYAVDDRQTASYTGGPCFHATVAYKVRSKGDASLEALVVGRISEARHITFPRGDVGQNWDDSNSSWLCLDDGVVVVPARGTDYEGEVATTLLY